MAIRAPQIDDSVPLSQQHSGRRVVELSLGIDSASWSAAAKSLGRDLRAEIPADKGATGDKFKAAKFAELFRDGLRAQGVRTADLVPVEAVVSALGREAGERLTIARVHEVLSQPLPLDVRLRAGMPRLPGGVAGLPIGVGGMLPVGDLAERALSNVVAGESVTPLGAAVQPAAEEPMTTVPSVAVLRDAVTALANGRYMLPVWRWPGIVNLFPYNPPDQSKPGFFLIERYAITSSLGNFGLGKTTGPFSLFPGESTEITVKTWLTSTETIAESSSIVDSFSKASADTFNSQLETAAGRSFSIDQGESYSNEWHASAGFSFIVSVGGGGGETRGSHVNVARDEFSQQVANTVQEHVSTANASRQATVTSSRDKTVATGREETVTRQVRNVNMRNCLNIVFRELNQEYSTRVHLVELRLGFQNGLVGSWREAPISQMRQFVAQFITDGQVNSVCQRLLAVARVVVDHTDTPVPVLEKLQWHDDGTLDISDVPGHGALPDPSDQISYRYKRGPLTADERVPGVVLSKSTVVMRTGTLIADALLSPGEALDDYAKARQRADAEAAETAVKRAVEEVELLRVTGLRMKSVVDALNNIADPEKRVAAYSGAYRPMVAEGEAVDMNP